MTPVESATATLAPGAAGAAPQVAAAFGAEPKPKSSGPMFQTLFHEGERGAVAPVVRELWGAPRVAAVETTGSVETTGAVQTPVAPAAAAAPSAPGGTSINAPLDLFRFLRPNARAPDRRASQL